MSKHSKYLRVPDNEDYKPKVEWVLLILLGLFIFAAIGTIFLLNSKN